MTTDRFIIRPFRAEDEEPVVQLWNLSLSRDTTDLATFRRKVILDANFDSNGCLVAEAEGEPIGFLLSLRRRYPYYDLGLEPGKGWITVLFVHPDWRRKGIGKRLVGAAEQFLSACGVREVSVSDYTPNYFFPGIDLDAYGGCRLMLESCGYEKAGSVYGMERSLAGLERPAEIEERFRALGTAGFTVEVYRPRLALELFDFLRRDYPGDLFSVAQERLRHDPECDEILVALHQDRVIGFSHFVGEHFGPFGIAREYAGRGIGPMLFYATADRMRMKGRERLWLSWTTGRAKDFYHRLGLRVTRRQVIMRKKLSSRGTAV